MWPNAENGTPKTGLWRTEGLDLRVTPRAVGHPKDRQLVEWNEGNQLIKLHPLIHFTEVEVWDYIKAHQVPYNKLHDKECGLHKR